MMTRGWKITLTVLVGLLVMLFGWRYNRAIENERAELKNRISSQQALIAGLETSLDKETSWGARLFEFEMARLKQLRAEVAAAQSAVEASSERVANIPTDSMAPGQRAGVVPEDSGTADVSPGPTPGPDQQDLRQQFLELRTARANAMEDYDLELAQSESAFLLEDSQLALQSQEAQNNVFRLADEVAGLAGYVDIQSLERLQTLRTALVEEQIRLTTLRGRREELQNQYKQQKIQAQVAREATLRALVLAETDLQNQIAAAQAGATTGQAAGTVAGKAGQASTEASERAQALLDHQRLSKEFEAKRQALAQAEQAVQKLLGPLGS